VAVEAARLVPARMGASEIVKDHGRSASHHANARPGARGAASAVMRAFSTVDRFMSHRTLVQYALRIGMKYDPGSEKGRMMKQIMILAAAAALAVPFGAGGAQAGSWGSATRSRPTRMARRSRRAQRNTRVSPPRWRRSSNPARTSTPSSRVTATRRASPPTS
jgi:hypothetical protein